MFEECVKAGHHSKQAKLGAEGHHLHDDYEDDLHHQHDHRHLDNDNNVNDSQQATLIQLWNLNSYIFKESFALSHKNYLQWRNGKYVELSQEEISFVIPENAQVNLK